MINIALGIFLFCSPILFLPLSVPSLPTLQFYQFGYFSNSINLVQLQIFMYGIILLVIASLFNAPKRIFRCDYGKWLLLIAVISVYLHPKTLSFFPTVFLGFLLYYIVSVCTDLSKLRLFFWIIATVSFLNTIFAILQSFGIHWIYNPKMVSNHQTEIIGLVGYKTQLGIYQAIAIPICYVLNPWLAIIPTIGLFLSKSGTAMASLMIGMIYMFRGRLLKYANMTILMLSFSIFSIFILKHFYQLSLRFAVWLESFKMSINHIFIGNGIGTFSWVENKNGLSFIYQDPYSLYLSVFHAVGIFGLIMFVVFLIDKIYLKGRGYAEQEALIASCLILIIVGFGYSFMDYPRLAGTAIILFGLLTAIKGDSKCLSAT